MRLFESQAQAISKHIMSGEIKSVKLLVAALGSETSYTIRLHSVRPTHCHPLTHQKRPQVYDLKKQFCVSLQTSCYIKHDR